MATDQGSIQTNTRLLIIYCGVLLSLSAFSVDITLPFFKAIATSLNVPLSTMHASVSWYIISLGCGQLIFGALSDRTGRKPALAIGLALFLLGALICAMANSLEQLLAGRIVQGVGGASGAVVGRAILRDLYSGRELARQMALAMAIFSVGPIIGPLLGVLLVRAGGSWQSLFYGMAAYSLLLIVLLSWLPETLQQKRNDALNPSVLRHSLARILGHRQSAHWLLVNAIMMTSMILVVSQAPLVYQKLDGTHGEKFALLFALHGTGIILGQNLNRLLINRIGVTSTTQMATITALMIILTLYAFASLNWLNAYGITLLVTMFAVCFLPVISNSFSLAMTPHGQIAGFASAFIGAFAQLFSGTVAVLLAGWIAGNAASWALALAAVCMLVLVLTLRPPDP